MKKKIASMLALLLVAVAGAWAQDTYTIKASAGGKSATINDAATLPYETTLSECYDIATGSTSHGFLTVTKAELTEGTNVTVGDFAEWDTQLTITAAGESVITVSATAMGSSQTAPVTITVTKNASSLVSDIEVTKGEGNMWTFPMPAKAVKATIVYDTDLALSEETANEATLEEWDGYEANVKLTRTLEAGYYNTFVAPFDIDLTELNTYLNPLLGGNMTVKKLTGSSFNSTTGELMLQFASETSKIEAGKPYLLKIQKQLVLNGMSFDNSVVSKTAVPTKTDAVDFIPTLGMTSITGSDTKEVLFLAKNDELQNPTSLPAGIKGFRAYFRMKGNASTARSIVLDFGEGEPTMIASTDNGQWTMDNGVYDLQGRKLPTVNSQLSIPRKGVYIQKGRKVVVK